LLFFLFNPFLGVVLLHNDFVSELCYVQGLAAVNCSLPLHWAAESC
jgi:hypothetical protein